MFEPMKSVYILLLFVWLQRTHIILDSLPVIIISDTDHTFQWCWIKFSNNTSRSGLSHELKINMNMCILRYIARLMVNNTHHTTLFANDHFLKYLSHLWVVLDCWGSGAYTPAELRYASCSQFKCGGCYLDNFDNIIAAHNLTRKIGVVVASYS